VFSFKITFFDDIEMPETPQIPINDIVSIVQNSFIENPYFDEIFFDKKQVNTFQSATENKKYIIPKYTGNNISYHLVHQVNTADANGMRLYESFVDAYSGEIVWQKSSLLHFEANIKMRVKSFDKYN